MKKPSGAPRDEGREPSAPQAKFKKGRNPLAAVAAGIALAASAACSPPPAPECLTAEKANEKSVTGEITNWLLVADDTLRIEYDVSEESVIDAKCQMPFTVQAYGMVDGHEVPISDPFESTQAGKSFVDVNPMVKVGGRTVQVSALRLKFGNTFNTGHYYSDPMPFKGSLGSGTAPTASEQSPQQP